MRGRGRVSRAALRAALIGVLLAGVILPTAGVPVAHARSTAAPGGWPAPPAPEGVGARGAVLWDPADGRILWGRDPRTPRPMASTTKIMTTLLAVEAGTLDETVTVSARAAALGRVPGGASLGLAEGEQLPMRDLLSGLMLRSGNDAAVAVAEHVAGTERRFTALMNERAAELGLDDTHFLNASGLTDDPAHRASPLDLARLAEAALEVPEIARWAEAARLDNPTFGTIVNRNELLGGYAGADGVKTGYTALAGRCLVASAEREGRRLISVVLGSEDHFADSAAILDHGFEEWTRYLTDEVPLRYRNSAGVTDTAPTAPVAITAPTGAPVAARVIWEPVTARTVSSQELTRTGGGGSGQTVDAGTSVGTLELLVGGEPVASSPLEATQRLGAGAGGVGNGLEDALRAIARLENRPVQVGSVMGPSH